MDFDQVRSVVDGIPHMDAHHGRLIYDHVRATKPTLILELGTANGVSAAYMCAALEANGHGRVVSIDVDAYKPGPIEVFRRLGLEHRADFICVPDSSYNWMLRAQVAERSDANGNCEPLYDFIFIDGAHEFTIDGLATVLATKLLKTGGWILFDDLDWTYSAAGYEGPFDMSPAQLSTPNVRAVFDLIVKQDPVFTEFREQDDSWGWAKKDPGLPRKLKCDVSYSTMYIVLQGARSVLRSVAQRRGKRTLAKRTL